MNSRFIKFRTAVGYTTAAVLAVYTLGSPHATADIRKLKCISISNESWTPSMARAYARSTIKRYHWNKSEYKALIKLWNSESGWYATAYNKVKESGRNAGGIPQILGLNPKVPAPLQIERGLAYIKYRYGKPSVAWRHHLKHHWY